MLDRKKAPEGMYTARQAMEVLGIPPASFYSLVNRGEINRILLPGRKEGFYDRSEIDRYARLRQVVEGSSAKIRLDFGLALEEDLAGIREMVAQVSGGYHHAVPVDILKGWIRRNPQSVHVLRRGNEVVGYIAMYPLPNDTLIARLSGKLLNREIPIDDVQRFIPNSTITLYVAEIAVKFSEEPNKQGERIPDPRLGARIMREALRLIADLKKQGTIVTDIYGVGTSAFGIDLSRKIGMEAMDLPTGVREDRVPFKLGLQNQTAKANPLVRKLVTA